MAVPSLQKTTYTVAITIFNYSLTRISFTQRHYLNRTAPAAARPSFFKEDQNILGRHFPLGIEDQNGIRRWLASLSITNTRGGKQAVFLRFPSKVILATTHSEFFSAEHVTFDFAFNAGVPSLADAHLTSNAIAYAFIESKCTGLPRRPSDLLGFS